MRRGGVRRAVAGRRGRRGGRRQGRGEHVARDLDEHRSAPPAHGRAERVVERLGDARGRVHLHGEFGDGTEHAHEVVVLEGVALVVLEHDTADQGHHRGVRDVGGRDAGEQVRGPGPARDQADAGSAGDAGEAVGHERGGLLVPDVDVLDAAIVVEGVEDVEERGADDPEDVAYALRLQQLDHRAAARRIAHALFSCVAGITTPRFAATPATRWRLARGRGRRGGTGGPGTTPHASAARLGLGSIRAREVRRRMEGKGSVTPGASPPPPRPPRYRQSERRRSPRSPGSRRRRLARLR